MDLIDKKFCLVDKLNLPNARYVKHGVSIDKLYLYKYNGKVYTSRKDLFEINSHLPKVYGNEDILAYKIPKPHCNQSKERKEFSTKFAGKTFADLGLEVIPLNKYQFNKEEIYVRRD